MTTMPQLHVTEVAHEAFVEGVHQVETMASHAMHGIGREADHMLDLGFIKPIKQIVAKLPRERQNLFFSATMPGEISGLASDLLKDPLRVSVTPVATTAERVEQLAAAQQLGDDDEGALGRVREGVDEADDVWVRRQRAQARDLALDLGAGRRRRRLRRQRVPFSFLLPLLRGGGGRRDARRGRPPGASGSPWPRSAHRRGA